MKTRRLLAVASGGGHWHQLMLMRGAFEGAEVHYVTTLAGLPEQFGASPATLVRDCNRHEKMAMVGSALEILGVIRRWKPDVVLSTGALPGVIALALGRTLGAKTIWVDSVANAEEMSLSGKLARRFAHVWLSQWPEVAKAEGADYAGSVL